MKRIFDFIISIAALILLLPVLIIIGILIKLLSNGPVFFIQERVGQSGETFRLIKFRTMSTVSKKKSNFDAGDTQRITRIGKILRKTKLDELPQLINIIKGEMSFVGPRPEVEEWTKIYPEKWKIVHRVRPGITDYASIRFRNEQEILEMSENPVQTYKEKILPQKLELNIKYIQNRNFLSDIRIIFLTIYTVIFK